MRSFLNELTKLAFLSSFNHHTVSGRPHVNPVFRLAWDLLWVSLCFNLGFFSGPFWARSCFRPFLCILCWIHLGRFAGCVWVFVRHHFAGLELQPGSSDEVRTTSLRDDPCLMCDREKPCFTNRREGLGPSHVVSRDMRFGY